MVIEMESEMAKRCLKIGELKIMWKKCRVYKQINLYSCFKCQGYNHKASECKNQKSCRRCAGNHDVKQCDSKELICVNCKVANENFGLKINVKHRVDGKQCTVYKKKVQALQNQDAFDFSDYQLKKAKCGGKFEAVIYMNVRKLMAHVDEVREIAERRKPLIILLTEMCVTTDIDDEEIKVEGYLYYNLNSHSRMTGGCVAYVSKNLDPDLLTASALDKCTWLLSFKVSYFNENCIFTVVYNSPAASKRKCLRFLEDWFENHFECAVNNIICGDFNVDLMKLDVYAKRLNELLQFYGVKQMVKEATRITEFTKSKLDLVITVTVNLLC